MPRRTGIEPHALQAAPPEQPPPHLPHPGTNDLLILRIRARADDCTPRHDLMPLSPSLATNLGSPDPPAHASRRPADGTTPPGPCQKTRPTTTARQTTPGAPLFFLAYDKIGMSDSSIPVRVGCRVQRREKGEVPSLSPVASGLSVRSNNQIPFGLHTGSFPLAGCQIDSWEDQQNRRERSNGSTNQAGPAATSQAAQTDTHTIDDTLIGNDPFALRAGSHSRSVAHSHQVRRTSGGANARGEPSNGARRARIPDGYP